MQSQTCLNSAERAGLRPKGNVPTLRFPEFTGGWISCKVGDYGKIITGSTPPTSDNTNYADGTHLWASPVDLGQTKYVIDTQTKLSSIGFGKTRKLPAGSVLITCIGSTIGKMGMAATEMSTNQQINSIVVDSQYDNNFVYYALQSRFPRYLTSVAVQAVPIMSKSSFEKLQNYRTALEEQKKIGALLNLIDERISTQIRIIEDLKSLSDVICERLYTPSEKGSWQTYKYADFFSISNERNSKLQYTNVLSASQEYGMIERNELNIDIKFEASSIKNYKIVRPNQYVIHLRSFQGGFAYSDKTGVCSPAYTILVPNEKLSRAFLKYYFTSKRFIDSLRIVTYGIRDGRSISVEEFLQLKAVIPDVAHQQHIVHVMQLWEEKIRTEEGYLSKLQQQKKYLLSSMFI